MQNTEPETHEYAMAISPSAFNTNLLKPSMLDHTYNTYKSRDSLLSLPSIPSMTKLNLRTLNSQSMEYVHNADSYEQHGERELL